MAGRVFLCDMSMRSFSGHCYGYLDPVRRVAEARGQQCYMVGNRQLDPDFVKTGVVPAFTRWSDEQSVGQASDLSREDEIEFIRQVHEADALSDLLSLDQRFGFRSDDLIILNSMRSWGLRGIVRFMQALGRERCPRLSLILLFAAQPDEGRSSPATEHYAQAFAAMSELGWPEKLRVFSDSDMLVGEFGSLSRLPIHLAPFPQHEASPRMDLDLDRITLGYVGEARVHKGFHLLPALASRLLESPFRDRVRLQAQSFSFGTDQPYYHPAIASLTTLPNVQLHPEMMDAGTYQRFVAGIDVFLIHYATPFYYRQTSSIYHLAVSQGCPVVASRGTWMARKVTELGGGVLCTAGDPLSLLEAVLTICRDFRSYKEQALAAGLRWRRFNNPENFLARMEARD